MSIAVLLALLPPLGALPAHAETAPTRALHSPAPSEARELLVLAGGGEIRAQPGAAWSPLTPGTQVEARGEIRNEAEPLRVQLPSGAVVALVPGSAVGLHGESELLLDSGERVTASHVDLRKGEIQVEPPRRTSRRRSALRPVLIHGFTALLALAQTGSMRARLVPGRAGIPDAMSVAVYEGVTQVGTQGLLRRLPVEHTLTLQMERPLAQARHLDAGPAWALGDGAALAVISAEGDAATLSLRVAALPGASGYEAEIARDEGFTELVAQRSLAAQGTLLQTPPLGVGRYFARVRARGPDGLPGLPGPSRALRVVRLSLPPGALAVGGTLLLPRDRPVTLDDPQGLEISSGGGGYLRATSILGPTRGKAPLPVCIRLAGEPGFVSLLLVPQTLRAEITLGPKLARWPADPVEIAVRVVDAAGTVPLFEPASTVSVNLVSIPVTWRHEGELFRATLAPVATPGPWVVRVETSDPEGNELGRNFLEIDRSETR
jgi:hypothetical protein